MLSQDSPSLVEMLLQNGANPNLRNKYQQSAVFMACQVIQEKKKVIICQNKEK